MTWVICDMDGTVLDSMPKLRAIGISLLQLSAGFGRENAQCCYDATVGRPFFEQALIAMGDVDKAKACAKTYEEIHAMLAPTFGLTSFGLELTTALSPAFQLILVSSTSRKIILESPALKAIPWCGIYGYDGHAFHKRQQIQDAMVTFDILRDECIYVGDVASDEAIAKDLGLTFSYPTPTLLPRLRHVEIVR